MNYLWPNTRPEPTNESGIFQEVYLPFLISLLSARLPWKQNTVNVVTTRMQAHEEKNEKLKHERKEVPLPIIGKYDDRAASGWYTEEAEADGGE